MKKLNRYRIIRVSSTTGQRITAGAVYAESMDVVVARETEQIKGRIIEEMHCLIPNARRFSVKHEHALPENKEQQMLICCDADFSYKPSEVKRWDWDLFYGDHLLNRYACGEGMMQNRVDDLNTGDRAANLALLLARQHQFLTKSKP